MLEGKALVVAIMMLTAAPLVVTDDGRAIVGDVTSDVTDIFIAEDPELDEVLDDAIEECLTLEEWKRLDFESTEDKVKDEVEKKDSESKKEESKKNDGSRNSEDCITESEYKQLLDSSKTTSAEEKEDEKPCYFLEDIKEEMIGDKEGWDREHWNKEDRDWDVDEEFLEELKILVEACEEGDETSCEELEAIREEMAADRDEEESNEEEGSRSGEDESEEESEDESEQDYEKDEFDEELMAEMQQLKEACGEGDEESCEELREMIAEMMEARKDKWNKERKDWHKEDKDWDEACLTMEEWKEVFEKDRKERGHHYKNNHKEMNIVNFMHMFEELDEEEISEIKQIVGMSDEEWDSMVLKFQTKNMTQDDWKMVMEKMKLLFDHKMKEDREEMEAFRVQMAELGEACEAGDETSCEELESLMGELENDFREDKEGECDKEHNNEEEDESEEEQTDEDESNEENQSEE